MELGIITPNPKPYQSSQIRHFCISLPTAFQLLLPLLKGMKKIDRYILVKYLTTFFFCLILFTAIVVVVDVSEKTDNFVKSKLPISRIITDYYFGFIPRIDAMLFPLFVFIAVIFFTSKMATKTILLSGVNKKARQNKETVDKVSATILLQSYMEMKR